LRDLLRFGVASNDAVVVGDGSDNTEKECPHCSVKLQSRKCPICGYAEEDIRGRLKTLKAREKFSLENVSPEAWLYAGPLAWVVCPIRGWRSEAFSTSWAITASLSILVRAELSLNSTTRSKTLRLSYFDSLRNSPRRGSLSPLWRQGFCNFNWARGQCP